MQKAAFIFLFVFLTLIVFIFVPIFLLSRDQILAEGKNKAVLSVKTVRPKRIPIYKMLPSPTPTPPRKPTPIPALTPLLPSQSLSSTQVYIENGINAYRTSLGLSQIYTDSFTCAFAAVRAKEIAVAFNHDGFTNRISNHMLPYPSYHQITENIAETGEYKQVVTLWINSPGHAENMRQDTPNVCVAQFGNYYAYEGWKP